jgi:hypothetical protein
MADMEKSPFPPFFYLPVLPAVALELGGADTRAWISGPVL